MKITKKIGSVGICLAVAASLYGFKPSAAVHKNTAQLKDSLIALEKQSWEGWKNHDGKFYQKFLSDDHVEIGSTGTSDKASVVAFVGGNYCTVESYTLDSFKVTVFAAHVALVTYHAQQQTTCNGKAVPSPVWVSSLYIKRDGHWVNALYQQSEAKK